MGKKSNKSIMRKHFIIIFISVLSFATLTGCGVKGSLYQTPEQQQANLAQNQDKAANKDANEPTIEK